MIKKIYLAFFDPSSLGSRLREKKTWLDISLVALILTILFSLPSSYKTYQESISQLEMQKPQFVQKLKDSGRWDKMISLPKRDIYIRTGIGTTVAYAFSIFITALLLLLGLRFFTTEGNYGLMLSSYSHSTLINFSLASLIKGMIIWAKGTTVGVTTSFLMFFNYSPFSKTGKALASFDLLDIWAAVVCGLIIASALSLQKKKGIYLSLGVWLFKAGITALLSSVITLA